MAAKYWLKLYHEIIRDYKMGRLSRSLRYRVIEMFCFAGECNDGGYLPQVDEMAWELREDAEQLESDLFELAKVGILDQRDGRWFVVNFVKRQAPSDATERVHEFRKRQRNESETKRFKVNTQIEDTDTDTEEEGAPPSPTPTPFPTTALEASEHPDIKLFHKVSGVTPGQRDYAPVIDAMTLLRKEHPDNDDLESYLLQFWVNWSGRKTKDGKAFNKMNVAWLTEWAINNHVPDFNKNGQQSTNEPPRINLTQQRLEAERIENERS